MIKELNDLVWYTEKTLWRDDALLAFLSKEKKEVVAIYEAIRQTTYHTDDAAARGLGLGVTSFKKYGKELKEHLRQMVFFFNDEKARSDVRSKNLIDGIRDLAAMRMLYAEGCRIAGRDVAEQLLRKGIQYECPDFVVQAAIYLKDSILRVSGTEKEFEEYSRLYWAHKDWLDWEHKAWEYLQRVQLPLRRRAGQKATTPLITKGYLDILEPQVGKIPSLMFHLYYFTLKNQYCMEVFDYRGMLQNCDRALVYIQQRSYSVERLKATFCYMKVVAYTYLGLYDDGRRVAEESLELAGEGTVNWFSALEVYFYLAMHTGNIEQAAQLYLRAISHRRFSVLHEAQQGSWSILGAYCYIQHVLEGIALPDKFPVFKSARFVNDTVTYSKDKDGLNISIQIGSLLFLLIEKKEIEAWDRINALCKYRERYLIRETGRLRSEVFIRILVTIVRNRYRKEALLKSVSLLLEELERLPRQLNNQAYELEIIPFEELTSLLLGWLKLKPQGLPTVLPKSVSAVGSRVG
jgi:hypothetical protein